MVRLTFYEHSGVISEEDQNESLDYIIYFSKARDIAASITVVLTVTADAALSEPPLLPGLAPLSPGPLSPGPLSPGPLLPGPLSPGTLSPVAPLPFPPFPLVGMSLHSESPQHEISTRTLSSSRSS